MKLAAVVQPATAENLRLLAQIGVEDLVYYNMSGMPGSFAALRREQRRVARYCLRLSVVEGGPPIDRIVLGQSGRDSQIEAYRRSLDHLGRLGIRFVRTERSGTEGSSAPITCRSSPESAVRTTDMACGETCSRSAT